MASFAEFADANQNGFSIVVVKAPISEAAAFFEALPEVVAYNRLVEIGEVIKDGEDGTLRNPDGSYLQITAHPDKRTSYLVGVSGSDWCVLYRTLEWAQGEDCRWVQTAAEATSKALETEAISISGSYVCDCWVYSAGETTKKLSGVDPDKVAKLFAEHGIEVPGCTIAGDPAKLLATASEAEQVSDAYELQLVV